MLVGFAKTVSMLLFIGAAVPCLVLGVLGLTGSLTDTSERENFRIGLTFVSAACLFAAPFIVGIVLQEPTRADRS